MKLYYLSNSRLPSRSANSVHVMRMCESFAKMGIDTTLFATYGSEACGDVFEYYGVRHRFAIVQRRRPSVRLVGGAIYRTLVFAEMRRRLKPAVIYGRDPYLLALMRYVGVPRIYESHAPPSGPVRRMFEKLLFQRKDFARLVLISEALRSYYVELFPWLDSDKIAVIPDGGAIGLADIDSHGATTLPGRREAMRVGYIGQLYKGRGIDLIVALAKAVPEVDFHIVGGGERDIETWMGACRSENVYFHGHVPHAKVGSYYRAVDILLAPYQTVTSVENRGNTSAWMSPLKVFEYMASGKPMIVSDLPVLREVLEDGVTCLFCSPNAISEWIEALRRLIRDRSLAGRLAVSGRRRLEERYSWDLRAKNVLAGLV